MILVWALASPVILAPRLAPASCAGPSISFDREYVPEGRPVTVEGEYWATGPCDDTGGGSPCGREAEPKPSTPTQDISVTLVRQGVILLERTVDANEKFEFRFELDTDGLRPGVYKLVVGGEAEKFTVERATND